MSNAQIQTETDATVGDVETNSPEVETALGIWRDVTQYLEEAGYEANATDLACAAITNLNLDEQCRLDVSRTDSVRILRDFYSPPPIEKDISEQLSFYDRPFNIRIDILKHYDDTCILSLTLVSNTTDHGEYVPNNPLRVEHITKGDIALRVLGNGRVIRLLSRNNSLTNHETVYTPELES